MNTPTEKAPPDVTLIALISAIGTALAAFQLFQPKFAIGFAMKRETNRVEPGFWMFYSLAQWAMLVVVGTIILVLSFAFVTHLYPVTWLDPPWLRQVFDFLTPEHLLVVLLMGACLAAIVQLNVLSWILLCISGLLSLLPIPKLSGAFGNDGRSAGWHQAKCICLTWDKGQPLLISRENIERVADDLLFKMSSTKPIANFAAKPTAMSEAAAANVALIGSIIENAHALNRWTKPSNWSVFFKALEDVHATDELFEPKTIAAAKSPLEYSERLRNLLADRMRNANEPVPEGNYFAVGSALTTALGLLRAEGSSIIGMIPWYAGLFGSKLFWLNRTLGKFPTLDGDSLRPQVVKLIGRWGAAPWIKAAAFRPPFSNTQGWLLLQESALTVFPEQKDVTFWGIGDKAIVREACRRVYAHLHKAVQDGLTTEAKKVKVAYPTDWDLLSAADFVLWSHATEEKRRGDADEWKASMGWRWKLNNGRASKIS